MADKEQENDIPEAVLQWLEIARVDGSYNMLAYNSVLALIIKLNEDEEPSGHEAVMWLHDNEFRYMEALNEMGARRTAIAQARGQEPAS